LGLLSYNFNPPSALFCARGMRGELVEPRSPCHWHSAVEVSSTCAPPRRLCIDKKSQAVHFHHAYLQKSLSCFLILFALLNCFYWIYFVIGFYYFCWIPLST